MKTKLAWKVVNKELKSPLISDGGPYWEKLIVQYKIRRYSEETEFAKLNKKNFCNDGLYVFKTRMRAREFKKSVINNYLIRKHRSLKIYRCKVKNENEIKDDRGCYIVDRVMLLYGDH